MKNKRKKSSRMHGSHTHGRGFKKKARGSGHRGGFGMAGTGKRADHKKTKILNLKEKYFGGSSLKAKPKKYKVINVNDVERLVGEKGELELKGYKLLGDGEIKKGVIVKVEFATKSAIEKIEKAGGKVMLPDKKVEKKIEMKEEKENETEQSEKNEE